MTARRGVRYEADSLLSAAEQRLVKHQQALSRMAPPWDGYCGLVQLRDDEPTPLCDTTSADAEPLDSEGLVDAASSSPFAKACGRQQRKEGWTHAEEQDESAAAAQLAGARAHGQHSAEEAESCFREAVQLIKGSKLGAAKSLLQRARELCPPDQQQAIQRIDRFSAAVLKAL